MGLRVVFVLAGLAVYALLREYFELPRGVAGLLAAIPWAIAEAKGVIPGPYEAQSAKDVMLAADEPSKADRPPSA